MNFLCFCQSVSWFNFLLKYVNRDISSSWGDIFLNFLGDIPSIYLEFFQIIMDFLYVCQSLSQSLISSTWLFLGVNFWDPWSGCILIFPMKSLKWYVRNRIKWNSDLTSLLPSIIGLYDNSNRYVRIFCLGIWKVLGLLDFTFPIISLLHEFSNEKF